MSAGKNTLYIANENGDWWEFNPDDVLFVLRASDLPGYEIEDHGIDIRDGVIYEAPDKFEKLIWEHGTSVEELHTDFINILDGDPSTGV